MRAFPAYFVLITYCSFWSCKTHNFKIIDSTDEAIAYTGRTDTTHQGYENLYYSGTSVSLNFEGEKIEILLKDQYALNYFNVILDGKVISILHPDTSWNYYLLASGLKPGKHKIELYKRTEWKHGKTIFGGFKITGKAIILPKSPEKKKRIEFYGNSITSGYAVEDFSGADSPDSIYTNHYLSYAAITARHFDAEHICICRSGIGITVSWMDETMVVMPEIYDRLNPADSNSYWDFKNYIPDIVVINLLQNDAWLTQMPESREFKYKFGTTAPSEKQITQAYQSFVQKIRIKYPNTHIICALGNMDACNVGAPWFGYIQQATSALADDKIFALKFTFKNTPGHPTIKEQQAMADQLIRFIDEHIDW